MVLQRSYPHPHDPSVTVQDYTERGRLVATRNVGADSRGRPVQGPLHRFDTKGDR